MIRRVRPKRKHHAPVFGKIAWSDYVLYHENRNPYRPGTLKHDQYEADYIYAEDSLHRGISSLQPEGDPPDVSTDLPTL